MFLQVCVCPRGGGAIPACIAGGIPACLAAGGLLLGVLLLGGVSYWGVWPSVMAFCCGLLLWPSGLVPFVEGGLLVQSSGGQKAITEGHHTRRPPHQKATTEGGTWWRPRRWYASYWNAFLLNRKEFTSSLITHRRSPTVLKDAVRDVLSNVPTNIEILDSRLQILQNLYVRTTNT